MNPNDEKLIPFYFGALTEEERLNVERELLQDTELLLDFLDLKRKLEAAEAVPAKPSQKLWLRLQPKSVSRKAWWISLAVGTALAASLCFLLLRTKIQENVPEMSRTNLIDTGAEQSAVSNVL